MLAWLIIVYLNIHLGRAQNITDFEYLQLIQPRSRQLNFLCGLYTKLSMRARMFKFAKDHLHHMSIRLQVRCVFTKRRDTRK